MKGYLIIFMILSGLLMFGCSSTNEPMPEPTPQAQVQEPVSSAPEQQEEPAQADTQVTTSALECTALTSDDVTSTTGSKLLNVEGPTKSATECNVKWIIGESASFSGIVSLMVRETSSTPEDELGYVCKQDLGIGDYRSCSQIGGIMFGKGKYFVNVKCLPGAKMACTQEHELALARLAGQRIS